MTESEFEGWVYWVIETCLRFGTRIETACKVAAIFAEGLRSEGVVE